MGGKHRTGKQIAAFLNLLRQPGQAYAEPFCGACNVTQYITAQRRYCYDKHAGMIALWQALQAGWLPPSEVSEVEYACAQSGGYRDNPALETFVLIGCSFSGKHGAGFAKDGNGRNYALNARRQLLHRLKRLHTVSFACADFFEWQPPESHCLLYFDPPYQDTEGYDGVGAFDNAAFWLKVQDLHAAGHNVYVSEYKAPPEMQCILEIPTKTDLRTKVNGRETRMERLFTPDWTIKPLQPKLL